MKGVKGVAMVLFLAFALIAPTVSADENDSGFSAHVEMRSNDNLSVDFRVRDHENVQVSINGVSVENVSMVEAGIDGSVTIEGENGILIGSILVENRETPDNLRIRVSGGDGTVTSAVFGGSGVVENIENFGDGFENLAPENLADWKEKFENSGEEFDSLLENFRRRLKELSTEISRNRDNCGEELEPRPGDENPVGENDVRAAEDVFGSEVPENCEAEQDSKPRTSSTASSEPGEVDPGFDGESERGLKGYLPFVVVGAVVISIIAGLLAWRSGFSSGYSRENRTGRKGGEKD